MKTIFTIVLLVVAGFACAQKLRKEYGLGYAHMAPVGNMKSHIRNGNGFTSDFYLTPEGKQFSYGIEFAHTLYGREKTNQLYTFDDGTTAPMDVIVYNGITALSFGGRYFLRKKALLMPYIGGRTGYSWFRTTLNIYDPDDTDHCAPVESGLLMKDGTLFFSAGAGIQYDLTRLFTKEESNRLIITLGINQFFGGQVRYMNADAPGPHQHTMGNEVTAQFVNTQTQVVHEHHVGYVYKSRAQMTDFRFGLIFRK